jgi:hypothetical protein
MSVTQVNQDNFTEATLLALSDPRITSIFITDSSYVNLDDTAISTTGGFIKIIGSGFTNGCNVIVGTTASVSTTFVSSTEVRAQIPALAAGTYSVYVVNTNGGAGLLFDGLTVSASPSWVTGSTLPVAASTQAYSLQLNATDAVTYSLQAGSTLPTGLTLTSGGLLSGTVTVEADTTYNFTIIATDAQLQDSPRSFSLTVNVFAVFIDGVMVTLTNNKYDLNTAGAYTLTVNGTKAVTFKMWGAGGGSGSGNGGGLGGYATGTVTLQPNTNYIVWVGGGGRRNNANNGNGYDGGFGGGGLVGTTNNGSSFAGSGGGLTGMFSGSATLVNSILIAGGGGGGGDGPFGGNGGGTTGGTGGAAGNAGGGGGGTQSAGGSVGTGSPYNSGSTSGSALTGGKGATNTSTNFTAGGGGGGYYGGGGGDGNNYAGGGGGGGSGYINTGLVTNGSLSGSGTGGTVPNNTDGDYKNNAGTRSGTTAGATAPPGLFVLIVST